MTLKPPLELAVTVIDVYMWRGLSGSSGTLFTASALLPQPSDIPLLPVQALFLSPNHTIPHVTRSSFTGI